MTAYDGGVTVTCPGNNPINVPNGSNGQPCTIVPVDGGANVTCPGNAAVFVPNGKDGTTPQACTVSPTDGGVIVACPGSNPVTILNGIDAAANVDFTTLSASEVAALDLTVTVQSVSNAARPVVAFRITDQKGRGINKLPPANVSNVGLMKLLIGTPADGGINSDTWLTYIANCPTCVGTTETATASTLAGLGDGNYTYTFAKNILAAVVDAGTTPGTTYDANAVHRLMFRLASSGNPFRPVDVVYEWIPSSGANVTGQNEKVNTSNCLACHGSFRANALNAGGATAFHGGQRYLVPFCLNCHNDQRKYAGTSPAGNAIIGEPTIVGGVMTPASGQSSIAVLRGEAVLNLSVFIHKIHRGENLALSGPYPGGSFGAEINHIRFPQNLANCVTCHKNAPLADNWRNKPSARACGSCHDDVDLTTGTNHIAGAQPDSACATCHTPPNLTRSHLPVEPPDPNNILLNPDGGNANTHASSLGNKANPPDGGHVITYAMPTGAVTAAVTADGGVNATVKFRLLKNGANVVFNTYDGGTGEMMDNFFGAPSVYCVWAMPQDGITAPADFNASASGYLKNIWKGTATGAGAGTLAGPDGTGNYTVSLTGVNIPPTATMLTCGVGYTYSLPNAQPLTQTDVPGYPFNASTRTGGMSVPAPNVWQTAVGYTGRRNMTTSATAANQVVTTAKCESCHNPLGVGPSFHAGQRNDGPSCAFCHTPNRTSSGWSANAASFVHGIHGEGKRTTPFNWHATTATEGFYDVTFPGRPQNCETCHTPGTYDFSSSWNTANGGANVARRLYFTAGQGVYDTNPATNKGYYSVSPYVVSLGAPDGGSTGGVDYGVGYAYSATTQAITPAAATTLVHSPITGSCFGCHDSPAGIAHMRSNGGSIYAPRAAALGTTEQCLICHGPGKLAPIKDIHYQ